MATVPKWWWRFHLAVIQVNCSTYTKGHISISIKYENSDLATLRITMIGMDRDSVDSLTTLIREVDLDGTWRKAKPKAVHEMVFREISALMVHEVAEWFRVDGVRVYDPHVEGGPVVRFEVATQDIFFAECV